MTRSPSPRTVEELDGRRAAWATRFVFAANGGLFATWVSRIPAVRDDIGASERGLGFALLFIAVGSLVAMPLSGRMVSTWGARRVTTVAVVVCALAYTVLGLAPNLAVLSVVLLFVGAGVGVWDVAMNVSAHAVEVRAGRTLMPGFHAAWSIGTVVGAGLGALAAKTDIDPAVHFTTLAVLVGAAAVLATRSMPDQAADERDETGELLADECAGERHVPKQRALIRDPRLIGLGVMTFCAAWAEGAANDWLALMLTDDRGASEALAALGFAVFAGAMTLGRVAGNTVVASLGRVRSLRAGAVVAYVGALLWGLGISIGFPLAMSAAGETPGRGPSAIATVATIAYSGFLVGPPLIGTVAHEIGLDRSLWVVVALTAGIFLLAGNARSVRGGRPAAVRG